MGQSHTCVLMPSHSGPFVAIYLLSGHKEWGLSPEAASAGQDDEETQSVSSLAALTLSIPETASSPQILGQTPFLHYQSGTSGRRGRHFGSSERAHFLTTCQQALGARRLVVLGSVPRCGDTARPHCADALEAATLPTGSWKGGQELAVSTHGAGKRFAKKVALR